MTAFYRLISYPPLGEIFQPQSKKSEDEDDDPIVPPNLR